MRVVWVSAQKGRFQEDAAQLYITFQKASELKNNSHLFFLYDYSFLWSFFFTLFCASQWFLSPSLISFGDLAWSLEGKMVLLPKDAFISNPQQPLLGVGGDGVRADLLPWFTDACVLLTGRYTCTYMCVLEEA